jgi:hypothetical protein
MIYTQVHVEVPHHHFNEMNCRVIINSFDPYFVGYIHVIWVVLD